MSLDGETSTRVDTFDAPEKPAGAVRSLREKLAAKSIQAASEKYNIHAWALVCFGKVSDRQMGGSSTAEQGSLKPKAEGSNPSSPAT